MTKALQSRAMKLLQNLGRELKLWKIVTAASPREVGEKQEVLGICVRYVRYVCTS